LKSSRARAMASALVIDIVFNVWNEAA